MSSMHWKSSTNRSLNLQFRWNIRSPYDTFSNSDRSHSLHTDSFKRFDPRNIGTIDRRPSCQRAMKVSSSCLGRNSSGNSGNSVPNSLQVQRDRLASSRCREPGHPLSSSFLLLCRQLTPLRGSTRPTPATESVDPVPLWGHTPGYLERYSHSYGSP